MEALRVLVAEDDAMIALLLVRLLAGMGHEVCATVATEWSAFGTGRFSGDGRTDILWTNGAGGQVAVWQMHGAFLAGFGVPQGQMGST